MLIDWRHLTRGMLIFKNNICPLTPLDTFQPYKWNVATKWLWRVYEMDVFCCQKTRRNGHETCTRTHTDVQMNNASLKGKPIFTLHIDDGDGWWWLMLNSIKQKLRTFRMHSMCVCMLVCVNGRVRINRMYLFISEYIMKTTANNNDILVVERAAHLTVRFLPQMRLLLIVTNNWTMAPCANASNDSRISSTMLFNICKMCTQQKHSNPRGFSMHHFHHSDVNVH